MCVDMANMMIHGTSEVEEVGKKSNLSFGQVCPRLQQRYSNGAPSLFGSKSMAIDQFREKYTNAKQNANWARGTREQTRKGYIRSLVIKTLKADIFQFGMFERKVFFWSRQMHGFMLIG